MTAAATTPLRSFAEYLALEATSSTKHEHVAGEILAMAGGTVEHGRLSMSIGRLLGNALAGRPCNVLSSDVRVRATAFTSYPDVSVVCGRVETDPEDPHTLTNPVLLVEVLSDSTETYNRTVKRAHYGRIPSLRDYLVVSQKERHIEHYHRNDDDSWTLRDVEAGGEVVIGSLDCRIGVDAVYANPADEGAG